MTMALHSEPVVGVILAGGMARRFGGVDKASIVLGEKTLLEHAIMRARPQVSEMIINAAGQAERFSAFGLPVVADVVDGFVGPLAGVLTGFEWARQNRPDVNWLASFAVDTPFMPDDVIERLTNAVKAEDADIACARSDGRTHPVFALWKTELIDDLRHCLVDDEMRKVDFWTARHRVVHVNFETVPVDPFFNVNRQEDLAEAEQILAELSA